MYRLYGVEDWGSLVVHMALEEIGAPFTFERIAVEGGGLDAPAFRALNPFGKVPVLHTPDGTLHETAAILLYLAERHGALMPVPGTPERARFLLWFALLSNQVHPGCLTLLHPDRAGGADAQRPVADLAHGALLTLLDAAEAEAARAPLWLSAQDVSVVSLWLVMLLRWLRLFPPYPEHRIMTATYPALMALARGIEARPAVARVLGREGLAADALSAAME
ncbi:MAG: glutathione S-transferase family protein [Pararhodobacter sp.]